MRICLVRHAQTQDNAEGRWTGRGEGTLNATGREQARKLAIRLKDESFDCIITSGATRTNDTASIINQYHQVPIYQEELLLEANLGRLEGKTKEQYLTEYNLATFSWDDDHGHEKFPTLIQRAELLLNMLKERYNGKRILLVGHSGINQAILAAIHKTYKPSKGSQRNTCVNEIEFDAQGPHIILHNCTRHLDD